MFRVESTEQELIPEDGLAAPVVGEEVAVGDLAVEADLLEVVGQVEVGKWCEKSIIFKCTLKNSPIFYKLHSSLEFYLLILLILRRKLWQ